MQREHWEVHWALTGSPELARLLADGWEPFAVEGSRMWLRLHLPEVRDATPSRSYVEQRYGQPVKWTYPNYDTVNFDPAPKVEHQVGDVVTMVDDAGAITDVLEVVHIDPATGETTMRRRTDKPGEPTRGKPDG